MRALPILAAVAVFVLAIAGAVGAVPPPVAPTAGFRRPAITDPPTPSPADPLESAIRERRWEVASRLAAEPSAAAGGQSDRIRDRIRRGTQRDVGGVLESEILIGALAAWGPVEAQRSSLKALTGKAPYTLPEKRLKDLLVFAPRKLDADQLAEVVDELRLLRIEGLDLNAAGKPLPDLGGVAWRFLGGTAIDRIPSAAFAASQRLEILDLTGRRTGIDEILAAVSGRPSLRILRLPSTHPLGPASLRALAGMGGLEDLSAGATGLTAEAFAQLASTGVRLLRLENQLPQPAFAGLGRLNCLHRLTCSLASGVDFAPLAALPELDELTLAISAAGGPSPDWLRFVQAKVLRLSQAGIDDRLADAISRMPRLDRLELNSTALTEDGLLLMATNPRLRVLELGTNPGLTGAVVSRLLRLPTLRELRLASAGIPESAVLGCPGPAQLERFTWGGSSPSKELVEHLITWPGMVRVAISGKLDPEMKKRLDEANERRAQVPPDLPSAPAIGF